ncbi:TM10B methyltransferase, partial [Prunella himalayana]|nr:TM10B methyltransferase [Prunella himalayana]
QMSLRLTGCFTLSCVFEMDTTPESYLDLFPLEAIVYLTPDSENVLEDIDPSKVYVLGGLVDESIHKQQLIRCWVGTFPGSGVITSLCLVSVWSCWHHCHSTCVPQHLSALTVFDVLSTFYETRSWPAALRAGVSSGKGYVLPDTAEQ